MILQRGRVCEKPGESSKRGWHFQHGELKQSIHFVLITLTSNNQRYSALWHFFMIRREAVFTTIAAPLYISVWFIYVRYTCLLPISVYLFTPTVWKHFRNELKRARARRERAWIDWSCMSAERRKNLTVFRNFRTPDLRFRYPVTSANIYQRLPLLLFLLRARYISNAWDLLTRLTFVGQPRIYFFPPGCIYEKKGASVATDLTSSLSLDKARLHFILVNFKSPCYSQYSLKTENY